MRVSFKIIMQLTVILNRKPRRQNDSTCNCSSELREPHPMHRLFQVFSPAVRQLLATSLSLAPVSKPDNKVSELMKRAFNTCKLYIWRHRSYHFFYIKFLSSFFNIYLCICSHLCAKSQLRLSVSLVLARLN